MGTQYGFAGTLSLSLSVSLLLSINLTWQGVRSVVFGLERERGDNAPAS